MILKPLKYRELIAKLRKFDLSGPFPGGKHPYFLLGNKPIHIPNPHEGDVGKDIVKDIIKRLKISVEEFMKS